jgi:hypothetical protein
MMMAETTTRQDLEDLLELTSGAVLADLGVPHLARRPAIMELRAAAAGRLQGDPLRRIHRSLELASEIDLRDPESVSSGLESIRAELRSLVDDYNRGIISEQELAVGRDPRD